MSARDAFRRLARDLARRVPAIRRLHDERDRLRARVAEFERGRAATPPAAGETGGERRIEPADHEPILHPLVDPATGLRRRSTRRTGSR